MTFRCKTIVGFSVPILLLSAATGCGTQQSPTTQARFNADRPVAFRDATVHAEARRVYEMFGGTQEQRDAGEVLRAYAGNSAMDGCLEDRGFPEWDWSLSRGYTAPYDPLTPTVWFAEPGDRTFSNNEIASGPYLEAEAQMNSDDTRSPEYERAIDHCLETVPPASDEDLRRAGQPEGTARLIDEWRRTMGKAGAQYGDFATYAACMDSADIPALTHAKAGYGEIGEVMTSLAAQAGPPPEQGADSSTYSEAWDRFLDQEGDVIAADLSCREDVYRKGIESLGEVIADFESAHAEDIARAETGWLEITEKAEKLGHATQ